MRIKQLKSTSAILAVLMFGAITTNAQQAKAASSTTVAPIEASPVAAASATPSDSSERERMLLERIDKLEKRLAALESRTPAKSDDLARANANVATAKSATDSPVSASPAAATPSSTEVRQEAANPGKPKKSEPFAFADWSWMTGNARTKDLAVDSKFFTPEIRFDVNYTSSFNHPKDNTIGGSSEIFRSGEVQLTQLGLGGDFHYDNVRGRVMTQIGMYSQTQPRNDISVARGQWGLDSAYRYISEAYGGYHIDKMHGINVDAGIFLSYIGLWSFYNFDNWTYQPSFVSSNTPWFFNGLRVQIFPSDKLKIEPWIINGWQSYGKFNRAPGIGGQIAWRPSGNLAFVFNNYYGADTLGIPGRKRFHTDDSVQVKYYDKKDKFLDKSAFSLTIDAGCENGGGVSCHSSKPGAPAQYFIGFMAYNRFWFKKDKFGLTLGGGAINNPGRYLVLLPPINGATAITGTPYFTENPGDPFKGLDGSITFDYMPSQYITFRMEYNHRASNVPYWSGKGGVTPPGGNTGPLGSFVPGWAPDLVKQERRYTMAVLVKF